MFMPLNEFLSWIARLWLNFSFAYRQCIFTDLYHIYVALTLIDNFDLCFIRLYFKTLKQTNHADYTSYIYFCLQHVIESRQPEIIRMFKWHARQRLFLKTLNIAGNHMS